MSIIKAVLLIDAMNLIYRVAHVFPELKTKTGFSTKIIYGFIKNIYSLIDKFSPYGVTVIWDNSSQYRNGIYPKYKGNRRGKSKPFDDIELKTLSKVLSLMGINQYSVPNFEADDVIAMLANSTNYKVVIVSEDEDFLQLIEAKIFIYQPIKKILVTKNNFKELYNDLSPKEYLQYKILIGDTSDNIKGVCGDKTALKLLKEYKLSHKVCGKAASVIKLLKNDNLKEVVKTIIINNKLMNLNKIFINPTLLNRGFISGDYDKKKLLDIFNYLEFNSFIKRII